MASQKFGAFAFGMAMIASEQYKKRQSVASNFFAGETSNMEDLPSEPRRAICILDSQPNETGKGVVLFEQPSSFARTKIIGTF